MNIRDAVLTQVEDKIAAGEALAAAVDVEQQARVALDEAAAEVHKARQVAMRAGWSEAELKKLGLVPSTRQARSTRPRRPSTTKAEDDAHA